MSKFYIAYGSNLNFQQMTHRCPTAKFYGTGTLENYALQFKGAPLGAHATVTPREGSRVPVGIWKIGKEDEKRLDLYEGCPRYYTKETVSVTVGKMDIRGMAYIMNLREDFGIPTQSYLEAVRRGYRDCGFDQKYLAAALDESWQNVNMAPPGEEMKLC